MNRIFSCMNDKRWNFKAEVGVIKIHINPDNYAVVEDSFVGLVVDCDFESISFLIEDSEQRLWIPNNLIEFVNIFGFKITVSMCSSKDGKLKFLFSQEKGFIDKASSYEHKITEGFVPGESYLC